jgi:hypothetical protein
MRDAFTFLVEPAARIRNVNRSELRVGFHNRYALALIKKGD